MPVDFKQYVLTHFENKISDYVEVYVDTHPEIFAEKAYRLHTVGELGLDTVDIKYVDIEESYDKILMSIVVEVTVIAHEGNHHFDDEREVTEWLTLEAKGNLFQEFDDFEILSAEVYQRKHKKKDRLTTDFVPVIPKERLDEYASAFLQEFYPEALKKPMPIDPEEIVERMGLSLLVHPISADKSVFGTIYFYGADASLYDEGTERPESLSIKGGTIIVDPNVYFMRNMGSVNNTIIHECVHWKYHRKAVAFERLSQNSIKKLECTVVGGIRGLKWNKTDTMEWQANRLAPRIQMPFHMFRQKAEALIHYYQKKTGATEVIDVLEPVIDDIAEFFEVSRVSAKIRMVDVGYEEARGVYIWCDDHYVAPHSWRKGYLEPNQTFTVNQETASWESLTNCYFLKNPLNSAYTYAESHFVLDAPEYVQEQDGKLVLTDRARHHMDECCLVFDIRLFGGTTNYHTECFLNRKSDAGVSLEYKFSKGIQNEDKKIQMQRLLEDCERENELYNRLPRQYTDMMRYVKKEYGMTNKQIAKETGISEKTIGNVCNGISGSFRTLSCIFFSLQVHPKLIGAILREAPYKCDNTKGEDRMILFALQRFSRRSYEYIHDFLHDVGVEIPIRNE